MLVYGARAACSRLFLAGAGADPIWSKPESALGPRTFRAGATQKSGRSATLLEMRVAADISHCNSAKPF